MVKQPCPAPAFPQLEMYILGLSAGGEAWEVLLYRVQSVCALKLSRPAAAWAFHKHTVSYHGLFQGLSVLHISFQNTQGFLMRPHLKQQQKPKP